jgi:hypothetical protein
MPALAAGAERLDALTLDVRAQLVATAEELSALALQFRADPLNEADLFHTDGPE